MKPILICLLSISFLSFSFGQINMEWILVEDLPLDLQAQSCGSSSDCSGTSNSLCYALVYTPTISGVFSEYITFFEMDCATDNNLSITYNQSCIMSDNSDDLNVCPTIGQRFNSGGNSGITSVTAGTQYLIHEICMNVPDGETLVINIRVGAVQSNATIGGIIEDLDVDDLIIDADLVCATLPVELVRFLGTLSEGNVDLLWITATEENNLGFEIQRSNNSRHWEILDFMGGQGTVIEQQEYHYQDMLPYDGINYYRIKQIDFDGNYEYSEIIAIDNSSIKNQLLVYPNPAKGKFMIEWNDINGTVILKLHDINGIEMKTMQLDRNSEIDISRLMTGTYILSMYDEAGYFQEKQLLFIEE